MERKGRLDWTKLITILVNDKRRNQVIVEEVERQLLQGRNILIISERVKHLKILLDSVSANGCLYIGEKSVGAKRKRDEEFRLKPKLVLTSKAMASEGFDWQECDTVIFATPFTASANFQQACGRCSRTTTGSSRLVDFVDRTPALKQISALL